MAVLSEPLDAVHAIQGRVEAEIAARTPDLLLDLLNAAYGAPNTRVRSDFGAFIYFAPKGVPLGRATLAGGVFEMTVDQSLNVEDYFAVSANPDGMPQDRVSQVQTGRVLRLSRYDLWDSILEDALGLDSDHVLSGTGTIQIVENWKQSAGGKQVAWAYIGNKLTAISRTINAEGPRHTRASGTFNFARKIKL